MDRNVIKQVIVDQKEILLREPYIRREQGLESGINYCFVGIRRAGKSFILYQMIHDFLERGGAENQFTYINFEDERLLEMKTSDLNTVVEIAHEFSGPGFKPLLFLDEIQNIEGWDKFSRRMADMKYRISITGSNSKMLSSEMASTLGGRFMIREIYPYSFREFISAKGSIQINQIQTTEWKATVISLFKEFLSFGGFPELPGINDKRAYLSNLFKTVFLGDIIVRNAVSNPFALRLMIKKMAESIMAPLSFSRLSNIISSSGVPVGKSTVIKYVDYAKDSFLIFGISNYAAKLSDKETVPKYYFTDQGLDALFISDPSSRQLENTVAVELMRRYGKDNVFFFQDSNVEVDFFIPDEGLAIQVCMALNMDDGTLKRETNALVKLKSFIHDIDCLILTADEESNLTVKDVDIRILPVWKWLLHIGKNSRIITP